jgi:hypothetical protein
MLKINDLGKKDKMKSMNSFTLKIYNLMLGRLQKLFFRHE